MKRSANNKNSLRQVRHVRVRASLSGTKEKPRLSVFRSLKSMALQIIDDSARKTICSVKASDIKEAKVEGKTTKVAFAYLMGKALAEKAREKGITQIVFDRGGYRFHGRVAAVAEGARAGGLQF